MRFYEMQRKLTVCMVVMVAWACSNDIGLQTTTAKQQLTS